MKKICADGPTIQGIDIYHGNAVQSFAGNSFVILKATEGTGMVDSAFGHRWKDLKAAGITRGAYHYFHPSADPVAQALHFASILGPLSDGDLPPALDVETLDGHLPADVGHKVMQCLAKIEQLTHRVPMIYGSPYFLDALRLPGGLKNPLWISHYGTACPLVPAAWNRWAFWQWSGTGLDKDHFNGDAAALRAFIAHSKA